jgi:hypothetical protein
VVCLQGIVMCQVWWVPAFEIVGLVRLRGGRSRRLGARGEDREILQRGAVRSATTEVGGMMVVVRGYRGLLELDEMGCAW